MPFPGVETAVMSRVARITSSWRSSVMGPSEGAGWGFEGFYAVIHGGAAVMTPSRRLSGPRLMPRAHAPVRHRLGRARESDWAPNFPQIDLK